MKVIRFEEGSNEFNQDAQRMLQAVNEVFDDQVQCLACVMVMKDGTAVTMCSEQPNWLTIVGGLEELKHRLLAENSRD